MKLSFEARPGYVFVQVQGTLEVSDALALCQTARDRAARHESSRVMVDLRDAVLSRDARDELLALARAPELGAAMLTTDDLFVTEITMASLAAASRVRGFGLESDAHRWLTRSSTMRTAVEIPSNHPRLSDRPVDAEARRRALEGPPRTLRPRSVSEASITPGDLDRKKGDQ